jgi:dTDP-4-amino-4,6-dideoxygalactose transaminase
MMAELALLGGKRSKTKPFPAWPQYDEKERQALQEVLESRVWWRTPGTKTLAFEREFAAFHGAKHGIAVTNGTAALEVVMLALGVQPGDEVIVPDFTFIATASAVLAAGALPVLVDIDRETLCIDVKLAETAITPRTKAIVAVHMGGNPADLDALSELCTKRGLALIEDCAAGTFSFQSGKLMTSGEGGMVITRDEAFERRARSAHDCGRLPGEWFYDHYQHGSNYRLSEWQGAVLSAQLTRLDAQTARRHANARMLDGELAKIEGITPQKLDARCTRNGQYAQIFHVDTAKFGGISMKVFVEAMIAEGIPNQASYPPLHERDVFRNGSYRERLSGTQKTEPHEFLRGEFTNTKPAAWETFWVPQMALLGDEEDMREIADAVKKIQRNSRELAAGSGRH